METFKPLVLNKSKELTNKTLGNIEDYLPEAKRLLEEAGEDHLKLPEAMLEIVKELRKYENPFKQNIICDKLAVDYGINKGDFKTALKQVAEEEKQQSKENNDESALITRAEAFITEHYEIRFNVISNRLIFREWGSDQFEDLKVDNIYRRLRKVHINISMSDLKSLLKSDFVPRFNAFEDYFKSLPSWDGYDHIQQLTSYIAVQQCSNNIDNQERFERMFKKMLVRSIACSLEKDFNKHCLTLVHDKQSSGKTTFLRWLCPPSLFEYYTENIGLTKDDMIALTENFIVNIDELSALSKYDINQLKSLLSKDKIKVRLPYGERAESLQRRCNFVASTNNLEFLHDETGSVRWICFLLSSINWEYKTKIEIDKVWAQAYHEFKNGFNYQLTSEEIKENDEANKFFFIRTTEMEFVQKYFKPGNTKLYEKFPEYVKFMTATDIITYIDTKVSSNIKLYKSNVGKALKVLGFDQVSKYDSSRSMSLKGYYAIVLCDLDEEQLERINRSLEDKSEGLPF